MSIKKELLNKLTEKQLKELAEHKGIKIDLNHVQKKYYADWDEKDKLVDIITDRTRMSAGEIEDYIRLHIH
jgi:hypothetical protein